MATLLIVHHSPTPTVRSLTDAVVAADDDSAAFQNTLSLKYVLVLASGVTAFLHARATSKKGMAVFGALTGLTALAALFVGIMLAE